MLTTSELAKKLSLSRQTVLRMANTGQIPCIKIAGGRGDYRFDYDEVMATLRHEVKE